MCIQKIEFISKVHNINNQVNNNRKFPFRHFSRLLQNDSSEPHALLNVTNAYKHRPKKGTGIECKCIFNAVTNKI